MATILDLFKSRKTEIYGGVGGQTYIESQGIVNIPRQTALLASSPNAIGGLIGNEIGGLVKGSADRVSDTVFKGKEAFRKPLIVNPGAITRGLRYAVEEGESYYIKKFNEPPSFINKVTQGASTPGSLIQEEAARFAKNPANTIETIKTIGKRLKNIKGDSDTYGPDLSEDKNFVFRKTEKKFTTHAPIYQKLEDSNGNINYKQIGIEKRSDLKNKYLLDSQIRQILTIDPNDDTQIFDDFLKENEKAHTPYVLFTMYGTNKKILLPGTISGLSEEIVPEWSPFKYLGSPFNLYRYNGVERSIQFSLKLYYEDSSTKKNMIKNLNRLRSLAFPNDKLSAINYGNTSDARTATLAIKPNLVFLKIQGYYENVFGIIDSLSFSIDDNTPWPSTNNSTDSRYSSIILDNTIESATPYEKPYPSVIDVSIGMKVIESPIIEEGSGGNDGFYYEYNENKIENEEVGNIEYFTNPSFSTNVLKPQEQTE